MARPQYWTSTKLQLPRYLTRQTTTPKLCCSVAATPPGTLPTAKPTRGYCLRPPVARYSIRPHIPGLCRLARFQQENPRPRCDDSRLLSNYGEAGSSLLHLDLSLFRRLVQKRVVLCQYFIKSTTLGGQIKESIVYTIKLVPTVENKETAPNQGYDPQEGAYRRWEYQLCLSCRHMASSST